jgi:hypothetical protein
VRKRPALFATIAVLLIGGAGASAVYLVGSKQRRDDRKAYLAYERAVLVPIDAVRGVAGEMRAGPRDAVKSQAWRGTLAQARSSIVALAPPSFVRDAEERWLRAIDAYDSAAQRLNDSSSPSGRDALQPADGLFDRAAELMQFHRRRLGLGPTERLPDPAKTT